MGSLNGGRVPKIIVVTSVGWCSMFESEDRSIVISEIKKVQTISFFFFGVACVWYVIIGILKITTPVFLDIGLSFYLSAIFFFGIHLFLHSELVLTIYNELIQEVCTLCEKDAKAGADPMLRYLLFKKKVNPYIMFLDICRHEWALPEEVKNKGDSICI
jgi:hypothetical protein